MIRILVLTLAVAAAACGSDEEKAKPNPAPERPAQPAEEQIPAQEIERGQAACTDWATEACRCAESQPDLAPVCEEAKKIPDALDMAIRSGNATGIQGDVRARLQLEARRIISRCIAERAKISCP
jgi:hypothetical protein